MAKKAKEPWMPPAVPQHITLAIKGLAAGNASDVQQRAALKWIVEDLCRTYDLSYRPGSDRDTVLAEGKRFVGLCLVSEVNINNALLRSKTDD